MVNIKKKKPFKVDVYLPLFSLQGIVNILTWSLTSLCAGKKHTYVKNKFPGANLLEQNITMMIRVGTVGVRRNTIVRYYPKT